jgi:hypothetical protein
MSLVYCYFWCFVSGLAAPLRGLRVLFLFSPKMRMKLAPHRHKLKYVLAFYVIWCAVLTLVTAMVYDKYRYGPHSHNIDHFELKVLCHFS